MQVGDIEAMGWRRTHLDWEVKVPPHLQAAFLQALVMTESGLT